jgi:Zn-dependent protease with chaperone function
MAWRASTFFSLAILLSQTLLAAVTIFYFMVLTTEHYLPKLILALVIAGAYAFYKVARLLLEKIPMQGREMTSEEVSESAAPALWSKVREVAASLGTAPPDTILVGMSTAFYVTESPIQHASGISKGRTLYLSAPALHRMPAGEAIAIIGHELGHFRGDDTVLTRELSPLLYKSDQTLAHLAQAGLVGIPALHAMNVFSYLFQRVISTHRRERELHADAAAASVTSPKTAALALVRYSYIAEFYDAGLREHLRSKAALESSIEKFRDLLGRDETYWSTLGSHATPHPFDTHPPISARTEKFGFKIDELRASAMTPVSVTAYQELMEGNTVAISRAKEEHDRLLSDVQHAESIKTANADELSAEVINKHFPQVVLRAKPLRVLMIGLILFLLAVALPFGMIFAPMVTVPFQLGMGAIGLVGLYFMYNYFANNYGTALTLNHLGLEMSTWNGMLKFEEVANISHQVQNGSETLIFALKNPRAPFHRKPLWPGKRKKVAVGLFTLEGKQRENAVRIYRYFTREIAP